LILIVNYYERAFMPQVSQSANQAAVLRIAPAAAYIGISRSYLYNLFRTGELARLRLGGRAAGVLRTDLDAWLQRQRDAA
jgi:excisionase family DNA binding protein